MNFKSKKELLLFLKFFKIIGIGSQGICYFDSFHKKVYKIFHQFFEEYDEEYWVNYAREEILRFSNIENSSYNWPRDVICVNNEVVGYVENYVYGKLLSEINPLSVNLDKFSNAVDIVNNDIEIISNNGVITYDVMYNTMYGKDGIKIIDSDCYSFSDINESDLCEINRDNFNFEIMYFLVDNYFDEFISSYKDLSELYLGKGINVLEFIKLFRNRISEVVGEEVKYLKSAKLCLNKNNREYNYLRNIKKM